MSKHATGTFQVKLVPMAEDEDGEPTVGRMSLAKTFVGDLEGTSKGQMLTMLTEVKDSAGYVAVERFHGHLHGRAGAFALQHSGVMTRGKAQLVITVVPDSGTGELVGLTGSLTITITAGKHFYEFDYALPEC